MISGYTDWAATGSMLSGVGSFVGAGATVFTGIAVICAANKAADTFKSWKRQKIAERKMEQAERILGGAYKMEHALAFVRGRMLWAPELKKAEDALAAKGLLTGAEAENDRLINAQLYLDRINRFADQRDALIEIVPFAKALFGSELEDALVKLNHQFWLVQLFAEEKIDHDPSNPDTMDRTIKIQQGLGASPDDPANEITNNIREAVAVIEAHCLPVLRDG